MKQKVNYKVISLIAALFTVLAFSTANYVITNETALEVINTNNPILINVIKFGLNYEKAYGVNTSILFFFIAYFYVQISKRDKEVDKRMNYITFVGGFIFAFFMVFGNSFLYQNNYDLISKGKFQLFISVINYIGYVFLFKNLFVFLILKTKDKRNQLRDDEIKKQKKQSIL